MNLYQKWLLAFALVILVAVGTIAAMVATRTEAAFRRYAMVNSNLAQELAASLADYYTQTGSWDGLQAALAELPTTLPITERGRGQGGMHGPMGGAGQQFIYQVADATGQRVADSAGPPSGNFSHSDLQRALPIQVEGTTVGYLLILVAESNSLAAPAQSFLTQTRTALLYGVLAAFATALLAGGLLVRGIVAPLHKLTQAAQAIAAGNLQARAPIQGHDEVAQLAQTFNQMAESLARAETARRAQTADIAHELRNPLAVLQGTLEALADGIYTPTTENIQPALDQVQTLNRLVEDLRLLALADAGQLRLERGPLDLGELLTRTAEAYRIRLEEKGLALEVNIPTNLPLVNADSDRLAQVIGNILSNAVSYLPAGCTIWVSARAEKNGVSVRLADNGPGVPAADLSRLFERFWRSDPSRSRTTGGSGLGLAIARQIVEAHGGHIHAEPTPGGGLTLAFWLPAGANRS